MLITCWHHLMWASARRRAVELPSSSTCVIGTRCGTSIESTFPALESTLKFIHESVSDAACAAGPAIRRTVLYQSVPRNYTGQDLRCSDAHNDENTMPVRLSHGHRTPSRVQAKFIQPLRGQSRRSVSSHQNIYTAPVLAWLACSRTEHDPACYLLHHLPTPLLR